MPADIKVLELSHTVMGPTAGRVFAELGADVINSAYREATEHFDRGLGLLPALSDPQELNRCEIELLLVKRGSLITIEEFASTHAG